MLNTDFEGMPNILPPKDIYLFYFRKIRNIINIFEPSWREIALVAKMHLVFISLRILMWWNYVLSSFYKGYYFVLMLQDRLYEWPWKGMVDSLAEVR